MVSVLSQSLAASAYRAKAWFPRPASRGARVALVVVNLACVAFFVLWFPGHGTGLVPYRIDLDVYRIGGRVWLDGGDLYGRLPPTLGGSRLPFTYPPIAAVLFAPLSLVPMAIAGALVTLATIGLVAVVLRVFLLRLAPPRGQAWPGGSLWWLAWLLPPALFIEPVRSTIGFGQVNVVLMALVALDCLLLDPRWPRGTLVGLAAAVKLTPAAFILFFLLRRDYRAVSAAALSFLTATGLGFLLAWRDSLRYWTNIVFRAGRIGGVVYARNQSALAVLARAGLDPRTTASLTLWLALSAFVLAAAWLGMRRALAAGECCLALSLNALAALLISPVSWSHHWVWIVPVVVTLTVVGWRHKLRIPQVAAVGGLVVFYASPQVWLPAAAARGEPQWGPWQQLIGSSYVLFAVVVIVLAATGLLLPPSRGRRVLEVQQVERVANRLGHDVTCCRERPGRC